MSSNNGNHGMVATRGSGMSSHGASGGVLGGARKVVAVIVTLFALYVGIQLIHPLMDAAMQLVQVISQVIGALTGVLQQVTDALPKGGAQ